MNRRSVLTLVVLVCLLPALAPADTFTLDLGTVFPSHSKAAPSSPALPWLTATFSDIGSNDVLLTMTALNLSTNTGRGSASDPKGADIETAAESVLGWWFNINPDLSARGGRGTAADLKITYVGGEEAVSIAQSADDGQRANSGGLFDFRFRFKPGTFTEGDDSVYELQGVNEQIIDASDFIGFLSTSFGRGRNGSYESAAKIADALHENGKRGAFLGNSFIGAVSSDPPTSPDGAVPEPGAWLLLGTVAGALVIPLRRRRIGS